MTAELEQIKVSYETLGMTPEQIAEDRELDIAAVKAGLMQCSSVYRRQCGAEGEEEDPELNFSNEQLKQVTQGIFHLAMYAEDEHLRAKMLTYVRDDKKGRKEVVKGVQQTGVNILQINQLLMSAKEGAKQLKNSFGGNGRQLVKDI